MFSIIYALQRCVKSEGFLIKKLFTLGTKLNVLKNFLLRVNREVPVLISRQHAQSVIEKSPVLRIT